MEANIAARGVVILATARITRPPHAAAIVNAGKGPAAQFRCKGAASFKASWCLTSENGSPRPHVHGHAVLTHAEPFPKNRSPQISRAVLRRLGLTVVPMAIALRP